MFVNIRLIQVLANQHMDSQNKKDSGQPAKYCNNLSNF